MQMTELKICEERRSLNMDYIGSSYFLPIGKDEK